MDKADTSNKALVALIKDLQQTVKDLKYTVAELVKENAVLKARIQELEHPKNSNNSSVPPSKDENRAKKNQSLRKKSGKKTGGQFGHKGHTLKMVENPDKVIDHVPDVCAGCGKSLADHQSHCIEKRQVVEIPPIHPVFVEHRSHSKKCTCGYINKSAFPVGVNSPIQYGSNIEDFVSYLSVGQYMSYNRIASFCRNMLHIPISQGSIKNMLDRVTRKSLPLYEKIRHFIQLSEEVGGDETGAKLNGDKWWFWVWQNVLATFITASDNRAFRTIEEHFPDGFENAVLLSDRYGAQLRTNALTHQLCVSHLLRDLNYLIELTDSAVVKRFRLLLYDSLTLKKQMEDEDYSSSNINRSYIRKMTFEILDSDLSNEHKKVQTLFKRLNKSRDYIYEFLYYKHVPPDNNGSERAIRNVKVKQKVSTMFKSPQGIQSYAVIRSIFDTCNKNGFTFFDSHKLKLSI
jgi:transposase